MNAFGTINTEKISIIGVRIMKASIDHPFDGLVSNNKGFKTDIAFKVGYHLSDKLAKAELGINVETNSEPSEKGTCHYTIHFIYHIDNLEELTFLDHSHGELTVSKALQNALASVSYSTARGMLLNRLQNTVFQDFILPVLNPDKLFDVT